MATLVIMPRQGQSVESCVITEWVKKVGDKVNVGDTLFSYETDKSSFDETSTVEGTLLAVFCEDGDDVPCLDPVCVIGEEGEDYSALIPKKEEKAEEIKTPSAAPEIKKEVAVSTAKEVNDGFVRISPRARHLAERTDADISKAVPTGPMGRIIERDINTLLDKGFVIGSRDEEKAVVSNDEAVCVPEYTDEKISNIRRVIAKSMHNSLSTMAQLTLNSSFDATRLLAYRAACKAKGEAMGLSNITINDMILFAVSKTLVNHKALNAHYLEDEGVIRYFASANLGIAVDTDRGLLVPTVFGAEKMSLNELSANAKTVIGETKNGTVSPDKLRGASFTVTNLGSMGIESFTPVVNPPQTGILGVGTVMRRVKKVGDEDVFYDAIGLSLTFDHRALDGAPAAKFLKELCINLENFDLLLSK